MRLVQLKDVLTRLMPSFSRAAIIADQQQTIAATTAAAPSAICNVDDKMEKIESGRAAVTSCIPDSTFSILSSTSQIALAAAAAVAAMVCC